MRSPISTDNQYLGGADATSEIAKVAHVHHPSKFFYKFFASIYLCFTWQIFFYIIRSAARSGIGYAPAP